MSGPAASEGGAAAASSLAGVGTPGSSISDATGIAAQNRQNFLGKIPGKIQAADIEFIVQWAISQSGHLPWARDRDKELAFDRGLTANIDRNPPSSWTIAVAQAGMSFAARPVMARMTPEADALIVIEAVKRLEPRVAATVLACARAKIRPDWMEGVEAKRVEKRCWKKKKGKRPCRGYLRMEWQDGIAPEAICAARAIYAAWHAALSHLSHDLSGRLSRFRVNGLAAPAAPWETPLRKTA